MSEQDFCDEFVRVMEPIYALKSEGERLSTLLNESGKFYPNKAPIFAEEILMNQQKIYQTSERAINDYTELLKSEKNPEKIFIYDSFLDFFLNMREINKEGLLAANALHRRFQTETKSKEESK